MPNKIDTDLIIRDLEKKQANKAEGSNADYVTELEKSSSLMPPEKPFETEAAQHQVEVKEDKDSRLKNDFAQKIKEETNEIIGIDKTNETKLFLLKGEYQKIAEKLSDGSISKSEQASLESLISDVQEKITLYKSKLSAGANSKAGNKLEDLEGEGEGDEGGGGEGGLGVLDGLKDQVLGGAMALIGGKKKEEEEEEEGEITDKEVDQ